MSTARDFYAMPGEPIRPKLRALANHIARTGGVQSGRGIRKHVYGNGTSMVVDPQSSAFVGAFAVRVSGGMATVGTGTVNEVVPTIDGEQIDGVNAEGTLGKVPSLSIEDGPNAQLRSWVCVEALYDAETGGIAEADDSLIVTHRADLPVAKEQAIAGEPQRIIKPLAILVWQSEDVVSRVRQITYFDQRLVTENGETRLSEAP